MTPSEVLVARAAAYELLSRFFREGLTPDLLEDMRGLPGIDDVLPSSVDEDVQAADHYSLLGLAVFPYASAYLEEDGRLGGATTDYIARLTLQAGRDLSGSDSHDHISSELDVLADLCRREAVAGQRLGRPESDELLKDLLDHLFQWLPAFCFALTGEENELYSRMARWVLDVAADHRHSLPTNGPVSRPRILPESPAILEDDSTGLRQLAEYLSRPALCGMVLTRSRIEQLARDLGVPRGFGDRALMLGNLLGAAGTYEMTTRLLARLRTLADGWKAHFEVLEEEEWPPALRVAATAWRQKVDLTISMIDEIDRRLNRVD